MISFITNYLFLTIGGVLSFCYLNSNTNDCKGTSVLHILCYCDIKKQKPICALWHRL